MSSPRKSSRLSGKKDSPVEPFGDPWTEEELSLFFDGYKKYGTNWKAFVSTIPGRTLPMMESLFTYAQSYLSLKEATYVGFVAILRDFNNLMKKQILAPTQANKTAKTPKNNSPKSNASKNGSAKRKNEDINNNNNNATQQTTSASPRSKRNAKGTLARQLFPTSPRPSKMQRTDVDSSKFEALTSLAANEAGDDQFLVPLKHREKMMRKVTPSIQLNSAQAFQEPVQLEFEYLQPAVQVTAIQNHFEQFLKQEKARKWSIYEWFYADIDKPFFAHNEFQECLDALGYSKVTSLTRSEWDGIRHKMGKVRRLSPAFFREEREKLNQQRQYIRSLRANKSPNRNGSIPREIPVPLKAGDSVMVHYMHSLYRGKILHAVDDVHFAVTIEHHKLNATTNTDGSVEPGSITLVVSDTHIAHHNPGGVVNDFSSVAKTPRKLTVQTPNPRQHPPLPHQQGLVSPGPPRAKFSVLDLKVLASFMAVSKNKDRILEEITNMNNSAEQMAVSGKEYPMPFRVRYANLIKELDQVNQSLEKCLFYFCQKHPPAPGSQSWSQRTSGKPISSELLAIEALEKLKQQSSEIVHTVFHDITLKEIHANENNNNMGNQEAFLSNSEPLMEVTSSMLTLLAYMNTCLESDLGPTELSAAVENALSLCKPKSDQNLQFYDELRSIASDIKTQIIKAKAG